MKRYLILWALSSVLLISGVAEAPAQQAPNFTGVGYNGEKWVAEIPGVGPDLAAAIKLTLLRGIYEGLFIVNDKIPPEYITNTSYSNLVDALDQFYLDYRNRKILVTWALQAITLEIRGAPAAEIDTLVRRMRELSAQMPG